MCGIAGFLGPFDLPRLKAMTDAIAHRGPDDAGNQVIEATASGHNAGLGHRRLSIIDLAGGHQPMWSYDRSVAIVFNGEIYNYRSLRSEIESGGGRFQTNSDTEVIVEGWKIWGERLLPRLEGMFAFGLWDTRTREWILARDRSGIKPLYYAVPSSGTLVFASEIRPLLPFLGQTGIELKALYEFLLYGWSAGPQSLFQGVQQLLPGHVLRVRADRASAPETPAAFARRNPLQPVRSHAAWVTAVREGLDRAVASHLVADVPVGVNLSGGLDSSAVVASMIRYVDPGRIDSFTVGFGRDDDETPHAALMAKHAGIRHHTRNVPQESIERDFKRIIGILEEPIAHPVLQTTYEAARLAREKVKVVLIGEGADELFLGYPQYRVLTSPFRYLPAARKRDMYLAICCVMPAKRALESMLAPRFLDRDLLDSVARRFDPYFTASGFDRGAQEFELDFPLVANQLMRIDKLTMAHGLEARVPFLDNQLVDLALSIPVASRVDHGRTKIVLRDAMEGRLPQSIIHRPKTGKGGTQALLPYLERIVHEGPLSDLVSREAIGGRGWLNPDEVLGYLSARSTRRVAWHPVESRRRQKFGLALAALEQWARIFLEGEAPHAPNA